MPLFFCLEVLDVLESFVIFAKSFLYVVILRPICFLSDDFISGCGNVMIRIAAVLDNEKPLTRKSRALVLYDVVEITE